MILHWETAQEKLKRYAKVSPKKKLELLEALHQMAVKASSAKMKKLRWKLRGA